MMSLQHDVVMRFYVTEPTTSFRTFDPMLWPPRVQTAYAKGCRGRLPSPVGLGKPGLSAIRSARGTGDSKAYRDTLP